MSTETTTEFCIVIPCYNEAKRIAVLLSDYTTFLETHPQATLCFVNDGSTDLTSEVLQNIGVRFPDRVHILDERTNCGKAEAVRKGIQYANSNFSHTYIGFLDADLSTPLAEFTRLLKQMMIQPELKFTFGSRIALLGSMIVRTKFRFFAGRMVATAISTTLKLKVYDTQCGCKLFRREVSMMLFEDPFTSRWLFDVEILFRMINFYGRESAIDMMREFPLRTWKDPGVSKVKWTYFIKLFQDLYRIDRRYNKTDGITTSGKREI